MAGDASGGRWLESLILTPRVDTRVNEVTRVLTDPTAARRIVTAKCPRTRSLRQGDPRESATGPWGGRHVECWLVDVETGSVYHGFAVTLFPAWVWRDGRDGCGFQVVGVDAGYSRVYYVMAVQQLILASGD